MSVQIMISNGTTVGWSPTRRYSPSGWSVGHEGITFCRSVVVSRSTDCCMPNREFWMVSGDRRRYWRIQRYSRWRTQSSVMKAMAMWAWMRRGVQWNNGRTRRSCGVTRNAFSTCPQAAVGVEHVAGGEILQAGAHPVEAVPAFLLADPLLVEDHLGGAVDAQVLGIAVVRQVVLRMLPARHAAA